MYLYSLQTPRTPTKFPTVFCNTGSLFDNKFFPDTIILAPHMSAKDVFIVCRSHRVFVFGGISRVIDMPMLIRAALPFEIDQPNSKKYAQQRTKRLQKITLCSRSKLCAPFYKPLRLHCCRLKSSWAEDSGVVSFSAITYLYWLRVATTPSQTLCQRRGLR